MYLGYLTKCFTQFTKKSNQYLVMYLGYLGKKFQSPLVCSPSSWTKYLAEKVNILPIFATQFPILIKIIINMFAHCHPGKNILQQKWIFANKFQLKQNHHHCHNRSPPLWHWSVQTLTRRRREEASLGTWLAWKGKVQTKLQITKKNHTK